MMPGEDGLSICRRLRAANDHTPIIMLTAKGRTWTVSWSAVGADDYLGKPFNPRELLARIPRAAAALYRKLRAHPSGDNRGGHLRPHPFDLNLPASAMVRAAPDHWRIRHAQDPGAPPTPAAVAQAGIAGTAAVSSEAV